MWDLTNRGDETVERGVTRLPEQRLSTLITCEFLGFVSNIGTSPTLIFDPYFVWKPQDVGAVDPQKTPPETVLSVNSACVENCAHSQRTQTPLSEVFDSTRAMGRRTRPVAHHEPQRAEVAGSRFDGIRRTRILA